METIKVYTFARRIKWKLGKQVNEMQKLEIHQKGKLFILIDELGNSQQLQKFHFLLSDRGEATLYAAINEKDCRVFAGCELMKVEFI